MKTNSDNQTTIQYDIYSDVDWRYFIDYYPSCERYIDKNIIGPCIQRNHNDNKDYWCKSNRYLLEEFTNNLILHMNNESKPIIFNMITYKESYNQVFTKFIDKGTFMGYTYKSDLIIFENITNIVNMSIMIFIVNALLILI